MILKIKGFTINTDKVNYINFMNELDSVFIEISDRNYIKMNISNEDKDNIFRVFTEEGFYCSSGPKNTAYINLKNITYIETSDECDEHKDQYKVWFLDSYIILKDNVWFSDSYLTVKDKKGDILTVWEESI